MRIETGPVKFGDDWPCVVLRGDDAARFSYLLGQCARHDQGMAAGVKLHEEQLLQWVALLNSCVEGHPSYEEPQLSIAWEDCAECKHEWKECSLGNKKGEGCSECIKCYVHSYMG